MSWDKTFRIVTLALVIVAGLVVGIIYDPNQPSAAEQKQPPPAVAAEKPAEPESLTAVARVSRILGLMKHDTPQDIDQATLTQILDGFSILGQLRPDDPPELKARFYLAALREWNKQNLVKIEEAKAKARLESTFDLGKDGT